MYNGDIFVNKSVPIITDEIRSNFIQNMSDVQFKTQPETFKAPNPAYVDRIIITSTPEEPCVIKMIQRQTRVPEVGDKFSSRHGQKGVVGLIVP